MRLHMDNGESLTIEYPESRYMVLTSGQSGMVKVRRAEENPAVRGDIFISPAHIAWIEP